MYTDDLFNRCLIEPARAHRVDSLFIVSGYASATFARRHLIELNKTRPGVTVNLIIGMPSERNDLISFQNLVNEYDGRFKAYYYERRPPVHAKAYSWFTLDEAVVGFAGSANYSQYGFLSDQQLNQISNEDPSEIHQFFTYLLHGSVDVMDLKAVVPATARQPRVDSVPAGQIRWDIPNRKVTISFLDKKGILPRISGLNWGQRVERRFNRKTGVFVTVNREPNQAYLSLKCDARREGFLPERAYTFSMITDDGYSFDCVVAQGSRKAILTTNNNSDMGRYFRGRLGIPEGAFVRVEDLERYGRTDYTIEKINEETFLLDFRNS